MARRRTAATGGWFAGLRVGVKIGLALVVSLLAGGVVAAVGLAALGTANANATAIYEHNLKPSAVLAGAQGSFDDELFRLAMATVSDEPEEAQEYVAAAKGAATKAQDGVSGYEKLGLEGDQRKIVTHLKQSLSAFDTVRDARLVPTALAGDRLQFEQAYESTAEALVDRVNADFEALNRLEATTAQQAAAETSAAYRTGRAMMIGCLAGGFVVAALLGWLTVRRITASLHEVNATLARLADGDLTGTVEVRSRDEVGTMAEALNRATGTMRETVQSLGTASQSLAAAAEELSATSDQIAGNAESSSSQAGTTSARSVARPARPTCW